MFTKLGRTVIVVLFTAALSAVAALVAPTASAATICSSGLQCIYSKDLTQRVVFFNSIPDLPAAFPGQAGIFDDVGAVVNGSTAGYTAVYYIDRFYVGFTFCVKPGSSVLFMSPGTHIGSVRLVLSTPLPCL